MNFIMWGHPSSKYCFFFLSHSSLSLCRDARDAPDAPDPLISTDGTVLLKTFGRTKTQIENLEPDKHNNVSFSPFLPHNFLFFRLSIQSHDKFNKNGDKIAKFIYFTMFFFFLFLLCRVVL